MVRSRVGPAGPPEMHSPARQPGVQGTSIMRHRIADLAVPALCGGLFAQAAGAEGTERVVVPLSPQRGGRGHGGRWLSLSPR